MTTARIAYDASILAFDLVMGPRGLVMDAGLESIVIRSLFTDAQVSREELLAYGWPEDDRRGFWGDAYPEVEGHRTGSKLWLLDGAPTTDLVIADAQRFAEEALQFLVVDGVLSATGVTASRETRPRDGLEVLGISVAPVPVGEAAPAFQAIYDATVGYRLEAA